MEGKVNENEYKLREMGNKFFSARTLSSHLQTNRRRRRSILPAVEGLFSFSPLSKAWPIG